MTTAPMFPVRHARLVIGFSLAAAAGALEPPAQPQGSAPDVAGFDKHVAETVERFGLAGAAVAVIDDGEVVLAKGYGLADCEAGTPVTTDTRFNIGSVSKLVSAWGVMRLVDEEFLDLDAPVWEYVRTWELPESPFYRDGVTIRRLLSHTAGLTLHGYPGFALGEPLPSVTESLSGATNGVGAVTLFAEPGTVHRYSGGGYTLLQLMCEELTGEPFAAFMHDAVFAPLGMTRTGFNRDPQLEEGTARPHGFVHDPLPDRAFRAEAAAAVYATLDDCVRLALAYFDLGPEAPAGRGVLSPEDVALMGSVVPESGGRWAHGPMVLSAAGAVGADAGLVIGHGGDNDGWHALIAVRPASRDALIVLTNGEAGVALREFLQRPWSALVGIDPLLPAFRPPAPIAIVGTLSREGGDAAVQEYRRLLDEEADAHDFEPRSFGRIAHGLLGAERAAEAVALLELAVEEFPEIADLWALLAQAHQRRDDDEAARAACERALELDPRHRGALEVMAEL